MLIDFLLLITSLIVISILFYTWNYDYWKKRRIPYVKPIFPFGSIKDGVLGRRTLSAVLHEYYHKYKDYKYLGVHFGRHPVLLIRDSQLARDVMVKYFNNFQDNTINLNDKSEPLIAKNPFVLKGDKWKISRAHLTPGFTALKLKHTFPNMLAVCERLVAYVQKHVDASNNSIQVKEVASNFTTEVFTLSALNITSDSFENPKSSFKTIANTMFEGSYLAYITWTLAVVDPTLSVLLRTKVLTKEGADYFRNAVNDVLIHREINNIELNDVFNHFYTIYKKNADFTKDDLVSNVVTLFIDGVETTATAIRGILYEIAANPRIFKKLREEIDTITRKHNNKLTYEGIQEMSYLDSCISEGLRVYSIVLFIMRQCTQTFEFPSQKDCEPAGVKIDKGISVVLPIYSIHHDANFYPNPEEYRPERFYDEATKVQAKANLFGFGDGPRICLGMRYGTLVTRLGLTTLISKFDVTVNEKSKERSKNVGPSFLFTPDEEPIVDFHKRGTIYKDSY